MALQMDYNDGVNDYPEAYLRVLMMSSDHGTINVMFATYADAATRWANPSDILTTTPESFAYQDTIDGSNPLAQSYALLKSRSTYSGALDV
ncbi:hypothetical protein [Paracraurococcus lichenis]|uniref:Uncharacterized protein n=1 Tax=Paracraurococcus lichenis TaxID=3064888 RepID=A0ABT9E4E0_9PROT|nr:hypothetical protein [Paracraurococcus sp. LOR1-02]MDO9711034.1 hypothetical protein [Paracraurococcus sp. LOR1-02]